MLVYWDAAPEACGEQGSVDGSWRSIGAILNAKPLGAEFETRGGSRAVTKSASVWESTRRFGWHKWNILESSHILQPWEKTLRVSQGDGSEIRKDQGFCDVGQEAEAPWKSQAMHVYTKACSSRWSRPK